MQLSFADSLHLEQIFGSLEGTVLLPPGDDRLRQRGADARQPLQLLGRSVVDVDPLALGQRRIFCAFIKG